MARKVSYVYQGSESPERFELLVSQTGLRREGDHMVARFTDEEWEKIQAVLETLNTEG